MPDSLFSRRLQTFSRPTPNGETMPIPVMTTRRMVSLRSILPFQGCATTALAAMIRSRTRMRRTISARLRLDVFDGILDGLDLFGRIIGNLAAELFLEGHHELDGVQAVRAQVVDEGRSVGDLRFLDPEVLDHDLLNPPGNVAHPCSLF